MQLKGSHSPSGLSLGLQIAAIGRRKARESGVCVGGVGDMGETGLVDRSTIRKALHKNQENKKRMKIKPLPCLEWSLPISPHQTAGIKHQIGCNPTKKNQSVIPIPDQTETRAWLHPTQSQSASGALIPLTRAFSLPAPAHYGPTGCQIHSIVDPPDQRVALNPDNGQ